MDFNTTAEDFARENYTDSLTKDNESEHIYLTDLSSKDKTWDDHKRSCRDVASLYDQAGFENYSKRIWECSQSLEFALKSNAEGTLSLKLHSTRFCRVRWCSVCLWRKSLAWRARFIKALPIILEDHPKSRFIFLTLTVKNCPIEQLRETLTAMNKAWQRLIKRKVFPAVGWVKSVEVTHGDNNFAHPHFHCLLMVDESYFGRAYLPKDAWVQLWKSCLRIDYDPWVDIRVVKNRKKSATLSVVNSDLMAGVLETIKYCVKPSDLVRDPQWLAELTEQMHRTRSIALGGIFKAYLTEEEPEDLIHTDLEEEIDLKDEDIKLNFDWAEIARRYAKRIGETTNR